MFSFVGKVGEKNLLSKYHLLKMLSLLQCALLASLSKTICEKRRHEFEEERGGVFWKFEGTKGKGEMWLKYNQKNHQKYTHELKELFKKKHESEILGSWVSIWVLSSSPLINASLLCITPECPFYYNVWYSLEPEVVAVPEWCFHCPRLFGLIRVFMLRYKF